MVRVSGWPGRLAIALALCGACSADESPLGDGSVDRGGDRGSGEAPVPVPNGFGDYCTFVAHECSSGLFCAKEPGEQAGFCTQTCPAQGEACEGVPAGSLALCLMHLVSTDEYACQFVCGTWHGATYPCPAPLTCTEDQQVSAGLSRCLP